MKFHPIPPSPTPRPSPTLPLCPRQPHVDLPLDLGKYRGKFGDDSYCRDSMHNEQTHRQTFFFIYIDISIFYHPSPYLLLELGFFIDIILLKMTDSTDFVSFFPRIDLTTIQMPWNFSWNIRFLLKLSYKQSFIKQQNFSRVQFS